jgi:hypothetical protein
MAYGDKLCDRLARYGTKNRSDTGISTVYDAPGLCWMVYFPEKWDVGHGDTASFPTKWMSADGKTLHLVFSGDDHFAVRKASLTAAGAEKSPPK